MKYLLREPLVHFLIIGGVLFVLFNFLDNPAGTQSDRIVITTGQTDYLKANFTRTWQRSPTEQEVQGLIESYVRDEIFYREALAMGLDRGDSVIRRRLKQKLEILSDDLAGVAIPSDEELKSFIELYPERFNNEPQVAFRHVFVNTDQRGYGAIDESVRLLAELSTTGSTTDPETLGDSLMLPRSFDLLPLSTIARLFGVPFSLEIMDIKPGQWAGPIESGYGLHLVLVDQHVKSQLPELTDIRKTVEREWFAAHKKELQKSIYKKLRKKYTIFFESLKEKESPLLNKSEAQATSEKQE